MYPYPNERPADMARRIVTTITRALTRNWTPTPEGVHFHAGTAGPYPCHDARCTSPHLDVG
jgi:hypothetical protein